MSELMKMLNDDTTQILLAIVLGILGVIRNLVELALENVDAGAAIISIVIIALVIAYLMKSSTKAFCSK